MGRFERKRRKNRLLFTFIALLVLGLVFLKVESQDEDQQIVDRLTTSIQKEEVFEESITQLTLNATSFNLKKGERQSITVTRNNSEGTNGNITKQSQYSTSNAKIAEVDASGVITAKSPGFASITVTYEGWINNIAVSVTSKKDLQVNVKDYGALGNGEADDTTAFQDAIDNLSTKGGGDIMVPEGTYILNPIYLKNKVNIVGENRDTVTLKLSDHAPDDYTRVINIENVHDVKVQNITCDGNSQNHPIGIEHMHCIFAWDSENILIDNNRLVNAVGDGISISGSAETSDDVTISNNILEDNHRSNIVLEQVNHLQIFNNISTSDVSRPALHFEPWEEMSFNDAKIWNNTFISNTEGYCVQLEGGKDAGNFYQEVDFYKNTVTCPTGKFLVMETKTAKIHHNTLNVSSVFVWIKNEDLKIYNNKIYSENGIIIEGTWGILSKGTQIFENNITTKGNGVHIIAGAQDTKIAQNIFTGPGKTGVFFFASETDVTNTTVSSNTFKNFENGIVTDYDYYDDKRINGLVVHDNTFTNFSEYALYIKGTTRNVTMDNNVVKKASGVYIAANDRLMENIEIRNNTISGGKRGIIQTQYGSGSLKELTISGNVISNTTDTGDVYLTGAAIELDRNSTPATNVLIKENVLTNNARNFITVPDSLLNSVLNNKD